MKKFKKLILTLLFVVMFSVPILTGCQLNIHSSKSQLDSPVITLYDDDNCISFKSVEGTTTYDIYCNEYLVYSYEDLEDKSSHIYDFSHHLEDSGTYKFYVIATSTSLYLEDSEPSNTVEKVYTKIETPEKDPVQDDEISEDIEFTLSQSGILSYTPIKNASYYVYMYSNNTGLNSYPITDSVVNISDSRYIMQTGLRDIYAVKLGYIKDGETHISNDMKFYNTVTCTGYTDNIYIFDGLINDFYITSLAELRNVMYYSFVFRIEEFNIKISGSLKNKISELYDGSYMVSKMNYAIDEAIDYYFETMAYKANNVNGGYAKQLADSTEYNIKISYYGVKECDTTIPASDTEVYEQGKNTPFHETVDYEMLGDDFDEFTSDNYYLYTTCSTSEQLYWAVENKITPRVVSGSRADTIYTKAKNVLREIISDEMTDYEKSLAIFDWICLNSNYDYTNYSGTYRGGYSVSDVPMYLPCYYLEGVFLTGNSVCDGFAKSYSLLCNMIGIDCIRIVGYANSGGELYGHAWNKFLVDANLLDSKPAQYYFADITWTEITSQTTEELSHLYFMLSDDDVKDTHINFSGRESKFSKYVASENYYYYKNDTFDYYNLTTKETTEYNFVIDNRDSDSSFYKTELTDFFYNALNNQYDGFEFVVDVDVMIDYYESVNGKNSYCSSSTVTKDYYSNGYLKSEYNAGTDTYTTYSYTTQGTIAQTSSYYKLRSVFLECLREHKFKAQYFTVLSHNSPVVYGDGSSDIGVLYIFSQSLLLNEDDDAGAIFDYMNTNKVSGTYTLYVEGEMLAGYTGTYVNKVNQLIASELVGTNLTVNLTHTGDDDTMQVFEMVIEYTE